MKRFMPLAVLLLCVLVNPAFAINDDIAAQGSVLSPEEADELYNLGRALLEVNQGSRNNGKGGPISEECRNFSEILCHYYCKIQKKHKYDWCREGTWFEDGCDDTLRKRCIRYRETEEAGLN